MTPRDRLGDLERQLGRLLRVGVTLSTLALGAGMVAALAGVSANVSATLLTIGVLLLIGTPFARVVVSSIAYARNRDWTFMLLTLVVLGELIASIIAAVRGGRP
jgi:uncharacterized membrane protein